MKFIDLSFLYEKRRTKNEYRSAGQGHEPYLISENTRSYYIIGISRLIQDHQLNKTYGSFESHQV